MNYKIDDDDVETQMISFVPTYYT